MLHRDAPRRLPVGHKRMDKQTAVAAVAWLQCGKPFAKNKPYSLRLCHAVIVNRNPYPNGFAIGCATLSTYLSHTCTLFYQHGEWVWVYIYEPMSMSSGSLSMWVCNAPLHRGQKRKIEKIALRYVCAGTGLKQAQRQRHDIHEYSLYGFV